MSHKMRQSSRLQSALMTAALTLLPAFCNSATLQEQLDLAVNAFSKADYSSAYWQLEAMEIDFGEEPEFLNSSFQKAILPVRAYAAQMSDRPTDALLHFSNLLQNHQPHAGLRAFTLYNAAIVQAQLGAEAAAAQTFESFRNSFPGSKEAGLALLQQADLLAEIGNTKQAEALLDQFYKSEAPKNLRIQGRLRALQLANETSNRTRTQQILFSTDWQLSAMPDIAVLCFTALETGDFLLGQSLPTEAIHAYRLALPRKHLIQKQRERLTVTQQALKQQGPFTSSIWNSHWQQLVARLQRQLQHLQTMPDYTPGLHLRKGQAYLLAQRHREASLLFKEVATNESYQQDTRAQAHYRWVLAASEAKQWSRARAIAKDFLSKHPKHQLANSALFLIARAHQNEGQYIKAIEVLDELIQHFPDDQQSPRWHFTRGYNYCLLENQVTARESFEIALKLFPRSAIAMQTELWRGLTFFFERNYDSSLDALQKLEAKAATHSLYPEIKYRIANIYYAQRDYESALHCTNQLIQSYPDHNRIPETQALRGDIHMGLGELSRAAHAFKQVSADDSQLYDYATFQTTKIYKALERYEQMIEHLQSYLNRDDAHQRPRVSEALYWIGWALQQEGRHQEAYPVFENALQRFGNNPEAYAVTSILSAYADLFKQNQNEQQITFDTWLQEASDHSLKDNQLTWFSRLTLHTANRQRHTIDAATADATLLSIHRLVPIDQQDPESLEAVGLAMLKRGYTSADEYFEQLLNKHPKHFTRAAAYYGKAKLAANADRLTQAQRWLVRFLEEIPTHHLATDARLLAAEVLIKQGRYESAIATLNAILQIKELRGRPHARALAGLAQVETERQQPERAIAYWQRLYTLYRAYPELMAQAYWQSALLFEQLGDTQSAHNTLQEMLRDKRLKTYQSYTKAKAKLPELETAAIEQRELATSGKAEEAPQ